MINKILDNLGLCSKKKVQDILNENEDLKARNTILIKENKELNDQINNIKDSLKKVIEKFKNV